MAIVVEHEKRKREILEKSFQLFMDTKMLLIRKSRTNAELLVQLFISILKTSVKFFCGA